MYWYMHTNVHFLDKVRIFIVINMNKFLCEG